MLIYGFRPARSRDSCLVQHAAWWLQGWRWSVVSPSFTCLSVFVPVIVRHDCVLFFSLSVLLYISVSVSPLMSTDSPSRKVGQLQVQLIAGLEKSEIWRVGTVSIGFARRCAAAGTVSIGRCRFY